MKINSELEDKGRKHKRHKGQDKDHETCTNRHMDNNGDADKSKSVTNGLKIVQFKEQPDMVNMSLFIFHLWIAWLDYYPSLLLT